MAVLATDDETAERAIADFAQETGAIVTRHQKVPRSDSGKVFFSSSSWNSPWEPEGPKKNWIGQQNPSLN